MANKKAFLEESLRLYKEVMVEVDLKCEGLFAPASFIEGENPILRIGYETEVSANLQITENGFSANMPFAAGVVSFCEVPWKAVINIFVTIKKENEKPKPKMSIVK